MSPPATATTCCHSLSPRHAILANTDANRTNSNAYRLIFWCLAHLLHDEALLSLIREEIRPAFASTDAKPDMAHLLDRCPNLASFYDEVLRLSVDPIAVRVTTDEVTLGGGVGGKGKVLRPGRRILAPFRQMHFDPAVWGPADVGVLAPRRFADNPKLQRSTSWRPFGGGNTHCPGRFIARREVYMFLAIVLFRFDVRLAPGVGGGKQKFPVLDTSIRELSTVSITFLSFCPRVALFFSRPVGALRLVIRC